jgi:outer membrane lipoprotein-sorting protein
MKKLLLTLSLLLLAYPAHAAPRPEQAADIARIEQYLNSITTLTANFTQIAPDGAESSGLFFLSRPGKLRWQYNPPVPILIVANGSVLSYYDSELKQLSHTSPSSSLAGFLTRKTIRFSGDIIIEELRKDSGLIRLTISQKDKRDQGKLTIIFNNNPLLLKKLIVSDSLGQQTTIMLSNIAQGSVLDNKLFIIENPKIFNSR